VIVNPVIAHAFHMQVEDFIGKKPEEILPPYLAKTIRLHDSQVIRDRQYHTYEEIIPIDGRDHHFQTVRFPLTDYKGETSGTCTIMRDVTSEHELRDQLVRSEKLAAVGKLAAGVAHEINNPLTGILAYAEDMMEEFPETTDHHKDLGVIVRETLRCREIVRNLLDFARQEKLNLQRISPNEVVEQALSLVQRLPQFRNINIELNLAEKIADIECDPQHIQQVILNLMLNAADAMEGSGTITLQTDFSRRQNRCMIEVEDTGPGIPENMIDKIFEPFFSTKGTNGLGLAVSWGIVERHQGVIEVDMAESGGAIFRIVLPAVES
jgi:PAS domain S-box-containing protein